MCVCIVFANPDLKFPDFLVGRVVSTSDSKMAVGKVVHREAFGSFPTKQRLLESRESLKLDNHIQYLEQGHYHLLEWACFWREFEFELVTIQWSRMFAAIFNSVLITKSSLKMAETRGRLSSPVTQKARGRTFWGLVNSLLIDGIEDPGPSHLSALPFSARCCWSSVLPPGVHKRTSLVPSVTF